METKIVFKDGTSTKVVRGIILDEAGDLIKIKSTQGNILTINKQYIIFMRTGGRGER